MSAPLACGCMGLVLAGLAAYAYSVLRDRKRVAPGLPDDGKGCMTEEEFLTLLLIELKQHETVPEPERS